MEQLPKIVAQRLQAVSRTEAHPDANLLTAFAEKSLLAREQAQILEHLALCSECREVVAHAQPEEVLQRVAVAAAAPMPARRSWLSGVAVRWAALAACVVVVGAVVISHTQFKRNESIATYVDKPLAKAQSEPQSAPVVIPEKKSATSAAPARLKTAPMMGAKRDADQLAELDKQRAAETTRGLDGERREEAPSSTDVPTKTNSPTSTPTDTVTMARAGVPPAITQEQEDAKSNKKEFSADKVMKAPAPTNEVAQAQAAPPPPPPPATAKAIHADQQRETAGVVGGFSKAKDGYVGGAVGSLSSFRMTVPMWQLSNDGKLIKSLDHGQNWQPVAVGDNVVFRALCVTSHEVWVGGAQGNLFYSSDSGQQWEQVKPVAKGQTLTADITAIEFKDSNHGKVTTADHQTWITNDGGHVWTVESR